MSNVMNVMDVLWQCGVVVVITTLIVQLVLSYCLAPPQEQPSNDRCDTIEDGNDESKYLKKHTELSQHHYQLVSSLITNQQLLRVIHKLIQVRDESIEYYVNNFIWMRRKNAELRRKQYIVQEEEVTSRIHNLVAVNCKLRRMNDDLCEELLVIKEILAVFLDMDQSNDIIRIVDSNEVMEQVKVESRSIAIQTEEADGIIEEIPRGNEKQISDLQKFVMRLREKVEDKQSTMQLLHSHLEKKDDELFKQLEDMRRDKERLIEEINNLKTESQSSEKSEGTSDNLQIMLADLMKENTSLQQSILQVEKEKGELVLQSQMKIESLAQQLSTSHSSVTQLQLSNDVLHASIRRMKDEFQTKETRFDNKEQEMKQEIDRLKDASSQQLSQIADQNSSIQLLTTQLEHSRHAISALKSEISDKSKQLQDMNTLQQNSSDSQKSEYFAEQLQLVTEAKLKAENEILLLKMQHEFSIAQKEKDIEDLKAKMQTSQDDLDRQLSAVQKVSSSLEEEKETAKRLRKELDLLKEESRAKSEEAFKLNEEIRMRMDKEREDTERYRSEIQLMKDLLKEKEEVLNSIQNEWKRDKRKSTKLLEKKDILLQNREQSSNAASEEVQLLREELRELQIKYDNASRQQMLSDIRISDLQESSDKTTFDLQQRIDQLNEEIARKDSDLDNASNNLLEVSNYKQKEIDQMKSQMEQLQMLHRSELDQLQAKANSLEDTIQTLKSREVELLGSNKSSDEQVKILLGEKDSLQASVQSLQDQVNTLQKTAEKDQSLRNEQLQVEVERLTSEKLNQEKMLNEQIQHQKDTIDQLRFENEELQNRLSSTPSIEPVVEVHTTVPDPAEKIPEEVLNKMVIEEFLSLMIDVGFEPSEEQMKRILNAKSIFILLRTDNKFTSKDAADREDFDNVELGFAQKALLKWIEKKLNITLPENKAFHEHLHNCSLLLKLLSHLFPNLKFGRISESDVTARVQDNLHKFSTVYKKLELNHAGLIEFKDLTTSGKKLVTCMALIFELFYKYSKDPYFEKQINERLSKKV